MSNSYTKKEWASLSIQERIKAMNRAVEEDENETPLKEQAISPVAQELPKRTSVVDMWRKRENPTETTPINSTPPQPKPNMHKEAVYSTKRSSVVELFAKRAEQNPTTEMRAMTATPTPTPTPTALTNGNLFSGRGIKVATTKENIVEDFRGQRGELSSPVFSSKPSSRIAKSSPPNDFLIIDDDHDDPLQQPEAKKFSVVDRWQRRGLTGTPTETGGDDAAPVNQPVTGTWNGKRQRIPHVNQSGSSSPPNPLSPKSNVEIFDVLPNGNYEADLQTPVKLEFQVPKLEGSQHSRNRTSYTPPSWQKKSSGNSTAATPSRSYNSTPSSVKSTSSWQKPPSVSGSEVPHKPEVAHPRSSRTTREGASSTPEPSHHLDQSSLEPKLTWSQRKNSNPTWKKPVVLSSTASSASTPSQMTPGAAQNPRTSPSPSWQKPSTGTIPHIHQSAPLSSEKLVESNSSDINIASSKERREVIVADEKSASRQSPKQMWNTHLRTFTAPEQGISSSMSSIWNKPMSNKELSSPPRPAKKTRQKISIDMSTKDEVDKSDDILEIENEAILEVAVIEDEHTLGTETSSVMEMWRKRESSSVKSGISASNSHRTFAKPSLGVSSKRTPKQPQLKSTAAPPSEQDFKHQEVIAAPQNEQALSFKPFKTVARAPMDGIPITSAIEPIHVDVVAKSNASPRRAFVRPSPVQSSKQTPTQPQLKSISALPFVQEFKHKGAIATLENEQALSFSPLNTVETASMDGPTEPIHVNIVTKSKASPRRAFVRHSPLQSSKRTPLQPESKSIAAPHNAQEFKHAGVIAALKSEQASSFNPFNTVEIASMDGIPVTSAFEPIQVDTFTKSTNGAVEWPIEEQYEISEKPEAPLLPRDKPGLGNSSVFETWKKRHVGIARHGKTSSLSPRKTVEKQKAVDPCELINSSTPRGESPMPFKSLFSSPRRSLSSVSEPGKMESMTSTRKSKALDLWRQHHAEKEITEDLKNVHHLSVEVASLTKSKPPANSVLMELGKKFRSSTPTSMTGSVEEKKDGEDIVTPRKTTARGASADAHERNALLGASPLKYDVENDLMAIETMGREFRKEANMPKREAVSSWKFFAPVPTENDFIQSTSDSEHPARISYRPLHTDVGAVNLVAGDNSQFHAETETDLNLSTKRVSNAADQLAESPARKLSSTIEKKRVQQHRLRLKQGKSDQSVSSVESAVAETAISQSFSDTVPDRRQAEKYAMKEILIDEKNAKLSRLGHPYSPPVDYSQRPRYDYDQISMAANSENLKRRQTSLPLKVQTNQSALSGSPNSGGAFSLYSRAKPDVAVQSSDFMFGHKTPGGSFSPRSGESPSARSFNYKSTNRYKHNQHLAARAKLIPHGAYATSNVSETSMSDAGVSYFSAESSGHSAKSIYMVKSDESEASASVSSSALANRASLVLKGRRNKAAIKSPEEKDAATDLTRRMLQGQPDIHQPPRRDRTAAYALPQTLRTGGSDASLGTAQREGLSSRYNSSSRFAETLSPQAPMSHNFRGVNSTNPTQKTYSFGSQASENSSYMYSPSSRSECSDAWIAAGGAQPIRQIHSASTEGTPSVQVDDSEAGRTNEIGNFAELQSVYRELDFAQIATTLKEDVETSLKGSVKEVKAMMSALLAKPVKQPSTPVIANKKVPITPRARASQTKSPQDEEVAIEVLYLGDTHQESEELPSEGAVLNVARHSPSVSKRQGIAINGRKGTLHSHPSSAPIDAARRGFV